LTRVGRAASGLLVAFAVAGCDGGGGVEQGGVEQGVDPARRAQALEAFHGAQGIMRARDAEGAVRELRRAVELDPELAEAWHLLGRHLLHLSDVVFGTPTRDLAVLDEAIAAFARASELQPSNATYAYWAGYACGKREDRERASTFLRRAIELEPGRGDAWRELGILEAEAGEVAAARESLARATELLPHDAQAWFQYGQQLEAEEDFEGARHAYQRAIEVDWTLPGPYSKLAPVLRRLGDGAGAAEAARNYELWGDFGTRFKEVLQAAKAAPKDPAKALAVARVYLEARRVDEALVWIDIALAADASHVPARELLASVAAEHPENARAQELRKRWAPGGGP
jgi:tetratricopeptide (TPR) repeat protein